jgi:hypothetical protein
MCSCAALPPAVYVDQEPSAFLASLAQLAVGNWVKLCRCSSCGQLWRVDEWDKYQTQIAVKVPTIEGWESFDSKPSELALLVSSRGGTSEAQCIWAGCKQRAVKGVMYCAEHLYETGARR